jgi:predicted MFS family arabinose efflux permease
VTVSPDPIWRDGSFLRLITAGGINMAMRWLEVLSTSVFTYAVTDSALAVALVNMVRFLPGLLFGFFTGVIADRFDRLHLLLGAQVLQTVVTVVLCVVAWAGALTPWHIGVGALINGFVHLVDFPVRRNMIFEIAGMERVGRAMGLDTITSNVTRIIGPAAGGYLYDTFGMGGVYLVSAAAYGVCVLVILGVVPVARVHAVGSGDLLARTREGLRYVWGNRALMGFMAISIIMNLWGIPYTNMVAVMGREVLDLSAFAIGLLMSSEGVGGLVGSLLVAAFVKPRHFRQLYLYGSILLVACVLLFSLSRVYELSLLIVFIAGIGMAGFVTMQSSLPYTISSPAMHARVLGVLSVCIGFCPIGILHLGLLADWFGTPVAIAIMAAEGLVAFAVLISLSKEVR